MPPRRARGRGGARGDGGAADLGPQIEHIENVLTAYPEWPRLVDDRRHAVNNIEGTKQLIDYYTMNGGKHDVYIAYDRICSHSQRLKGIIDDTNWQFMCQVDEMRHDNQLVVALIERWWPTTHTFHLPNIEVGFTPYDMTAITGLACGLGRLVNAHDWRTNDAKTEKLNYFQEMFPTLWADRGEWLNRDIRGIRLNRIKQFFTDANMEFEPLDEDPARELSARGILILRLFFCLVIGRVWLPNSPGMMPFSVLHTLEDVTRVREYDWGSAGNVKYFKYINVF